MAAADDFAERVAASFGMRPRRHGRELRCPCPVHEADGGIHKPSMAIWDKGGGRFAFKCMTGCSQASVRAALKDRGISVPGMGPQTTEQQLASAKANEERRIKSLTQAQMAMTDASVIEFNYPAAKYLRSRGIEVGDGANDFPTLVQTYDPNHVGGVVLAGVICDLSTLRSHPIRSTGIAMLSLNKEDGVPRLVDGKKFRSIVGTQKGFGVPFGKVGPHVVVAEGLETAISALELTGADFCVATLSASNMPFLAIPEWVRKVTIAQDNDEPGINAGNRLREEIKDLFDVRVMTWAGPEGWDANDQIMKEKGLK